MEQTAVMPTSPSLARRLGSLLYDSVLLFGVLMLAVSVLIIPYDLLAARPYPHDEALYRILMQLYLLAVIAAFYTFFWTRGGQTLGMRTWRIQVVRDDGGPLALSDALRRFAWADAEIKKGNYAAFRARMLADNLAGLDGLTVGLVGLARRSPAAAEPRR